MVKQPPLSPGRLHELLRGHVHVQLLHVAARLGIADLVKNRPRTVEELAQETGAHPATLKRVLRVLVQLGVFVQDPGGGISASPAGRFLEQGRPGSIRELALLVGSPFHWEAWGSLHQSVMSGKSGIESAYGQPLYEYLKDRPEEAARFFGSSQGLLEAMMPLILKAHDFSRYPTVVDVGGGEGAFLAAVLRAHPGLRGVLFDLPEVVERARAIREDPEVAARCERVGGSFLEKVPPGGDVYCLVTVLQDWDDDTVTRILANCRAAMSAQARLLILTPLYQEGLSEALRDLDMLVFSPSGRLRTEQEFKELLAAAGLRWSKTTLLSMGSQNAIIEATPAEPPPL